MKLRKFFTATLATLTLGAQVISPLTSVTAQEETVKIGANVELSGYSASYGTAISEAVELAVANRNEAGGVLDGQQLELVAYDNKSDKTETVSVTNRLVEEGVTAILGPGATDVAMAEAPVIEEAKVPTILPAATADHLTSDADGNVLDYLFRIAFTYTYQANAAARFAKDDLGAQKAVVLVDSANDYSLGQAEPFIKEWERLGGEVVMEEYYTAGETDFSAILTRLLSTDFDVIYLPAFYTEGGLITKQAREMGITQPILSGHGFASDAYVDLAGPENTTDVYYTSHFYVGSEDPATQEFVADYNEMFGKNPDAFAALGYDAANVLFDAIDQAGSADRDAVRDALENMEEFTGITGTFHFDELHNAVKAAPMLHMVNGEVENVYEVDGSEVEE